MINFLAGQPGGGKSYEAVAFHIIPALSKGRKVITNLALNLEEFPPEQRDLLEIRTKTKAVQVEVDPAVKESITRRFGFFKEKKFRVQPFSHLDDYGDTWRHPDDGYGPLYVIDECHLSLPKIGTPVEVEEWYSLHRHEFADVLLLSQGYGKVNAAIVDLVQVFYRVKKATAFGFQTRYIRKVFDGIKGDNVNTTERKYNKKFFKFYKSHTKSEGAGKEEGANDIVPIWKRWPFIFAPIFLIAAVVMFTKIGFNPVSASKVQQSSKSSKSVKVASSESRAGTSTTQTTTPSAVASSASTTPVIEAVKAHPLVGYGLHVAGYIVNQTRGGYFLFTVSQNGQAVFTMNQDEMKEAGYKIKHMSDCVASVQYEDIKPMFAVCDSPKIGMSPGNNFPAPKT